MSSVRFGAVYIDNTNIDTWVEVAEGNTGFEASVVLNFCNQSNADMSVSLAYIGDPLLSGPLNADVMWMNRVLHPGEPITTPAIALSEIGRLVVRANAVGLSVVAYGFRDPE